MPTFYRDPFQKATPNLWKPPGHTEIAALLLQSRARVDARLENAEGPLHAAVVRHAVQGDASLVDLLLKSRAKVDARDPEGYTALGTAVNLPAAAAQGPGGQNPTRQQHPPSCGC